MLFFLIRTIRIICCMAAMASARVRLLGHNFPSSCWYLRMRLVECLHRPNPPTIIVVGSPHFFLGVQNHRCSYPPSHLKKELMWILYIGILVKQHLIELLVSETRLRLACFQFAVSDLKGIYSSHIESAHKSSSSF